MSPMPFGSESSRDQRKEYEAKCVKLMVTNAFRQRVL